MIDEPTGEVPTLRKMATVTVVVCYRVHPARPEVLPYGVCSPSLGGIRGKREKQQTLSWLWFKEPRDKDRQRCQETAPCPDSPTYLECKSALLLALVTQHPQSDAGATAPAKLLYHNPALAAGCP